MAHSAVDWLSLTMQVDCAWYALNKGDQPFSDGEELVNTKNTLVDIIRQLLRRVWVRPLVNFSENVEDITCCTRKNSRKLVTIMETKTTSPPFFEVWYLKSITVIRSVRYVLSVTSKIFKWDSVQHQQGMLCPSSLKSCHCLKLQSLYQKSSQTQTLLQPPQNSLHINNRSIDTKKF